MPRTCTVCNHPDREAIDKALIDSEPFRHIASQFSVTTGALQRHKNSHLAAGLVQAQQAQEVAQADSLLQQLRDLHQRTMSILDQAEKAKDLRTALFAVSQARGNLELLGKLAGELAQENTVNILVMPEWITLRTVILQALLPFPDARLAVSEALSHAPLR